MICRTKLSPAGAKRTVPTMAHLLAAKARIREATQTYLANLPEEQLNTTLAERPADWSGELRTPVFIRLHVITHVLHDTHRHIRLDAGNGCVVVRRPLRHTATVRGSSGSQNRFERSCGDSSDRQPLHCLSGRSVFVASKLRFRRPPNSPSGARWRFQLSCHPVRMKSPA